MCSGRVDLTHVFRAFSKGADGVFVIGCHLGECNYITHGNYHALSTVLIAGKMMERVGLNPERLRIEFISGGEGILFAETMNDIERKVKAMGPIGEAEGIGKDTLAARLDAVTRLIPSIRLVERERLRLPLGKKREEVEAFFNSDEVNRIYDELIADKLAISEIMSLLRQQPLSTGEIAERLVLSPSAVSRHMNTSSRHGLVRYDTELKRYALA
ncbi:methyl-viologen-reducing hydrogenase, delta subunit [Syntrophus aciditrophicus SB]|uniref:Methyl-viologen-reducing hydrogenase, delta subunit n=2 Tax=Syntrophus TaxID=43773 RepID=Q2LXB9_SYNAS|nr:methyl-viologen-reducing hydrogenase, delta subunit [Syntrophus aciditrophicus SB]OPY16174.1 MAG: Methyl-viologen-reducing hydrogenase, delta subunit [Syntrophus sp. PtaB.Bin075]